MLIDAILITMLSCDACLLMAITHGMLPPSDGTQSLSSKSRITQARLGLELHLKYSMFKSSWWHRGHLHANIPSELCFAVV